MRIAILALAASLALQVVFVTPASAQPESSALPCASSLAESADIAVGQCIEEGVNAVLQKAMRTRSILLERGMDGRANRLWGAASEFAAIVRDDDPDEMAGFLPILAGLIRGLEGAVDQQGQLQIDDINLVQTALDDQLEIYRNPGLFPGPDGLVAVTVRAIFEGHPAAGYYASLDLYPLLPAGKSVAPLSGITDNARGKIKGGKFYVRVYRPNSSIEQGCIIRDIGRNGTTEVIDVIVDGSRCAR